jgi:hypothetical protein
MILVPDLVLENIYQITPEILQARGVRGLLIDLDGTMASSHTVLPPETVRPFLQHLQSSGLRVMVLSNNKRKRVERFCSALGVPWMHRATKPLARGFRRGAKLLGLPLREIAVVGDQIYTDTFGGNLLGCTTIYVRSIDADEPLIRLRYQLERPFIRKGEKNGGKK